MVSDLSELVEAQRPLVEKLRSIAPGGRTSPELRCAGIDLGATMTSILFGGLGGGERAHQSDHVSVRHLTAIHPTGFLDQLVELNEYLGRERLGSLASLAIGAAGPIDRCGDDFGITISNLPKWYLGRVREMLRKRGVDCHLLIVNDVGVGLAELARGDYGNYASLVLSASGSRTARRWLKLYQGTGINCALLDSSLGLVEMEYGYHPFCPSSEFDWAVLQALQSWYGRSLITVEDVLGGRGVGVVLLLFMMAAGAPVDGAIGFRNAELGLLRNRYWLTGDDGPIRVAQTHEHFNYWLRAVYTRLEGRITAITGHRGLDNPEVYRAVVAAHGMWICHQLAEEGHTLALDFLKYYGRTLALVVLSLAETNSVDVVYVGNRFLNIADCRESFERALTAEMPAFRHGDRLVKRLDVSLLAEFPHEECLLQSAQVMLQTVGRNGHADEHSTDPRRVR